MHLLAECRAPVFDHRAMKFAHMSVAHRGGDTAIGDDAGEIQMLDAALLQHPFETRGMERRIRDFLDVHVRGREFVHHLLAPTTGREVSLFQERSQRFQMRRDDRLTTAAGHQCEERCHDEDAALACELHQRRETRRQCGDCGIGLPGAAVGTIRVEEVILQVAEDQRGRLLAHLGSTITLPSLSTRATCPGSITVVASGCSRMAGPSIAAPAGSASRDHTLVSRKPPVNHTLRDPVLAPSSEAEPSGANTEKSNDGRRPIAATRNDTMRTASPGRRRLNDAEYAASKAFRTSASLTPFASAATGSGTATVWVCPR